MNIEINRLALLAALKDVRGFVKRNTTMPVLTGVLLAAKDEGVVLTATSLDAWAQVQCPVVGTQERGEVILPQECIGILQKLTADNIIIDNTNDGNVLNIHAGSSKYTLHSFDVGDFPQIDKVPDDQESVTLDQKTLKTLLDKVRYSVSYDETRYVLNGILIIIAGGKITAVATNGKMLASVTADCAAQPTTFILPNDFLALLLAQLDKGSVDIVLHENTMFVVMPDKRFMLCLIEGEFPKYKQVIPDYTSAEYGYANINLGEYKKALDRLMSIMDPEIASSVVHTVDDGTLRLAHTHRNSGVEEVVAKSGENALEVNLGAFLAKKLLTNVSGACDVYVHLEDARHNPVMFIPSEASKYDELYLIMPVNIK